MRKGPAILLAATVGVIVGLAATATTGGLIVVSMMVIMIPGSRLAPFIAGVLLLAIFICVFAIVFREILGKVSE